MNPTPQHTATLFDFLTACGVSQQTIATRAGVSKALVSLWRSGQRSISPQHYAVLFQLALNAGGALPRYSLTNFPDEPLRVWVEDPSWSRERFLTHFAPLLPRLRALVEAHQALGVELAAAITQAGQVVAPYLADGPAAWPAAALPTIDAAMTTLLEAYRQAKDLHLLLPPSHPDNPWTRLVEAYKGLEQRLTAEE